MTVGNFNEVIGSDGFDSIRAEEDVSVVYGVGDGDNLTSSLNDDDPTSIVVGGAGDNNYVIFAGDSTTFILENSDSENTLFNIGSNAGISLEDDDSFVAEIDDRHLYLGDTARDSYVVIFDWQLPENQIETLGGLSYEEFADSFRESDSYRGDFTWAELAETEEVEPIDLESLGLSAETLDDDLETINQRSQDLSFITSNPLATFIDEAVANLGNEEDLFPDFVFGDTRNETLRGTVENEAIVGGAGNDRISGNFGDDLIVGGAIGEEPDAAFGTGGSDTLLGGYGNDAYYVSLSAGGGSVVQDEIDPDDSDVLFITAADTDTDILFGEEDAEDSDSLFGSDEYLEAITDPITYGDSAIAIAEPEAGTVGIEQLGTDLIIDISRDGIADADDDLTIVDFFDEDGGLGNGSFAQINNIIDPQAIADFF